MLRRLVETAIGLLDTFRDVDTMSRMLKNAACNEK